MGGPKSWKLRGAFLSLFNIRKRLILDRFGLLVPPRYSLPRAPIRICSVEEMREMLLEHGATNTRQLQQDGRRSKPAIENDPVWLKKFHDDPR